MSLGPHRAPPALLSAHDPSVTFEEYHYWAELTRADERIANLRHVQNQPPWSLASVGRRLQDRLRGAKVTRFAYGLRDRQASEPSAIEKTPSAGSKDPRAVASAAEVPPAAASDDGDPDAEVIRGVSPEEWKQASRALRTTGWGAVFYLITTETFGPFGAPWAFAQMGYGPGFALYTVFGAMSLYSGWIIWRSFMGLDSDRYPVRGYGDLAYRLFGAWARHLVNVMQSLQLLLLVALLILGDGQSISQISQGPNGGAGLCFVVCLIIFTVAGFILGQIRTLRNMGWFASVSVWTCVIAMIVTMAVAGRDPPNFQATQASFGDAFGPGPILTFAGTPPEGLASGGVGFVGSLNGLNQAVLSYGSCMLFVAFLAEMRNPFDFWKAVLVAEVFIYGLYVIFGMVVYSQQGQFTFNPAFQGLTHYGWQTTCNVLNLISSLICACLYGNIGLKLLYVDVLEEVFAFPPLTVARGKFLWVALMPLYWALAFVVGAAVPQFSAISGLVSALFVLSFTYTFPAAIALAFWLRRDALAPERGERFDPATRTYAYADAGTSRYLRSFWKKPVFHTWNVIYVLGSLATTGLGAYSSIEIIRAAFNGGSQATSFSCTAPV